MNHLNLVQRWKQTLNHLRRAQGKRSLSQVQIVNKLVDKLAVYLDKNAIRTIHNAYRFGAAAHSGQKRSSGEDYIFHPLEVACLLADMRMDTQTIVAAILHDVVEDTEVSLEKLSQKFGEDVARLVDGVSKVSQLETQSKEQSSAKEQIEAATFRKMFLAMSKDIRVIIIKLADRLHNMSTLDALRDDKKKRIAQQTLDIYAPIATRLGMAELAHKLEDLSLQALDPDSYYKIIDKLERYERSSRNILREICDKVDQTISAAGLNVEVNGRKKNAYSVYRKTRIKHVSLDEIQDFLALRIICEKRIDCYQVLGIIHQMYKPRPNGFKDYIAIPKANGYQSLHTIVFGSDGQPVEFQIRSQAMHRVAEKGVASHWLYKTATTGEHAPQQLAQQWLDSFLELQAEFSKSGEYLEHLKADLFPDKVYVFTPKGDIKRLPRGATALDFAYSVHSDIGNQCIAAYINNNIVPLNQPLKNGDHVKVLTSTKAHPLPSWLNYVVSSRARASIHKYLNHQEKKGAVKLGKKLLRDQLRKQGYKKFHIPRELRKKLAKQLSVDTWSTLLSEIGLGKRLAALVAKQLIERMEPPEADGTFAAGEQPALTIKGTEKLLTSYATCCYPIAGDDIIGNITQGRGITIHRSNCANLHKQNKDPDKLLILSWADDVSGSYQVKIGIIAKNEPGVLAKITDVIAKAESNINSLSVEDTLDETARITMIIEVSNRNHLAEIIRNLHSEPSLLSLKRLP